MGANEAVVSQGEVVKGTKIGGSIAEEFEHKANANANGHERMNDQGSVLAEMPGSTLNSNVEASWVLP